MPDIYFWRQCLFLAAGLMYSLCAGMTLGYPSVLNLAITSMNSTDTDIHTTQDHATWIAAFNGIGGVAGAFILAIVMDLFGRRAVQYAMNSFICLGWLIFPFARGIVALYAARFIQGISSCNVYITCIIMGEFVHPSRRGYFVTLKKVAMGVGTLICHGFSAFWTWRQIAILAAIPPIIGNIIVFFLPESPSHLAVNGKFEECEKSFMWMLGDSVESQKELKKIIETQRNCRKVGRKHRLVELMKMFVTKEFQKALLMSTLLSLGLELCGRYFIVAYAIQIMKSIVTSQTSALYFTLGADIFILIALSFSTLVVKFFKRRTVLFSSGTVSVILMFSISALTYANTIYNFSKYFLWSVALILILQCFIVNLGLIPVSFALVGEIFNLEHKSLAICVSDLVFTLQNALILKVTPIMMDKIGLHGTYGVFGMILMFCLIVLCKTVPETKDKTLQDIEEELNGDQSKEIQELETLMH